MVMPATLNIVEHVGRTKNIPSNITSTVSVRPDRGITRVSKDTSIDDSGWKLALDMGIELEYASTGVIAVSPWIDDYGQGHSQQDAISNLLLSLVEFRESLEERRQQAQLSKELADVLEKLRILLVRDAL